MIEELKQVVELLIKMPELAFHGLVAFGIYKLVIYLSTTGVIYKLGTLAIEKLHDFATKPRTVTTVFRIDDKFIIHDGTYEAFMSLLKSVRTGVGIGSSYIHRQDVDYLAKALEEKRERDRAKASAGKAGTA